MHSGSAKFDLCFTFVAGDGGYPGFLEYASDLFYTATAEHLAEDFQAVLSAVTLDPDCSLAQLRKAVSRDPSLE